MPNETLIVATSVEISEAIWYSLFLSNLLVIFMVYIGYFIFGERNIYGSIGLGIIGVFLNIILLPHYIMFFS